MKKYFVFSDIHGNLKPLVEALDEAGFNMDDDNHILLSLGDHFDRGTQNLQVLAYLMHFDKLNRIIMIRGNHDDFLLKFLKNESDGIFNIQKNGFGNTLIELASKDSVTIPMMRDSINKRFPNLITLLEKMIDKFELGDYVFTHAGYAYDKKRGWYIYNFASTPYFLKHFDTKDKYYVFGHAHASAMNYYELGIESNDIFEMGNFIGIDANTVLNKKVHILIFDEFGNKLI
ncbi:metallophosphoesterase [Acholeplasma granularum]|uniref:metallophosphoesterase n=1 Tax=Acholeplasma granularum TaxID=264635 RepID=UPI000472B4F9|nr:metallophosphoesterase [Acholeplasma granularum]